MDEKTRNSYLAQGVVLLCDAIGKSEAVEVLARIEYLALHRPGEEIRFLINSPGGQVKYSLAIYEAVKGLSVPVATGCAGMADGSAALLLASGTKGRRGALSHSVIHVTDIWRARDGIDKPEQIEEVERIRKQLAKTWAECTGRPEKVVSGWMSSQKRFTASEAVEAGIIDFEVPGADTLGGGDVDILGLFRPCGD